MSDQSNDQFEARGHCLCEKVSITARTASTGMGACHCRMCRRWSGGPFMELDCGVEVEFDGEDSISIFDSSEWAERGFCSNCGTHLFYRLKGSGEHFMPVGLFEEGESLHFSRQVFIDEKPGYYAFSNETRTMTAAEVFAYFGSS